MNVKSVCTVSLSIVAEEIKRKKIEVRVEIDKELTSVRADERRLKQILVNLLSNAVKFTPESGRIGLDVFGDKEEETIHFVVWDAGIGIADDEMKRLFKHFVQLDSGEDRTGRDLLVSRRDAD